MASLRALLFVDVVGSTELAARLGDARLVELWTEHDRLARRLLATHGGREIDRSDGFFLLFESAAEAARFALAYHARLEGLGMQARAGLHFGSVVIRVTAAADVRRGAKPLEVEGLAKSVAARLMALAGPGRTLLGRSARDRIVAEAGEAALRIESHGHYRLKGLPEPLPIFELLADDRARPAPPSDVDKAWRVVAAEEGWRPAREVPNSLPAERDAFVGRADDLAALAGRFDAGERLVTLLGPGGIGKTRLAVRYARDWLGDRAGGAWLCDCSEARSADAVFAAVAAGLCVPLGRGDAAELLGQAIAARGSCLILLDSFERAAAQAAEAVARWLDAAPAACFLVTTRELLHWPGESVQTLQPLPPLTEGVELFARRAAAQRSGFAIDTANRGTVERIVDLLDGLPLAIELAAARIRVLVPAQIEERLRDRFELLVGARGAPARQATLRATIDWSWQLLGEAERRVLAQCSVFEGGFTLEAAEAVLAPGPGPDAPSTLDAVQSLVDKSLLRTWQPGGGAAPADDEPRFGLYATLHEYATEKRMADAAAASDVERRHGRHFAVHGSDAVLRALASAEGARRRRRLALDLDNLVAACRRAVARADVDVALAALRAAWDVLDQQGPFETGIDLGEAVLGIAADGSVERAIAATTLGRACWMAGRLDAAAERLEEACDRLQALAAASHEAQARLTLSSVCRERGDVELALRHGEAGLALATACGDTAAIGEARAGLGTLQAERGRSDEAVRHYESAEAAFRAMGDRRSEGRVLGNRGNVLLHTGRTAEARRCYEAALRASREAGNRRGEASVLCNLGNLAAQQGRPDEAIAAYEESRSIAAATGARRLEGLAAANLARVHLERNALAEARALSAAAFDIARAVRNRRDEAFARANLGRLAMVDGRLEEARSQLEIALAIGRVIEDPETVGDVLVDLADAALRGGEPTTALRRLAEAEAVGEALGDVRLRVRWLCTLGRAELDAGKVPRARVAADEAARLARQIDLAPETSIAVELAALRRRLD